MGEVCSFGYQICLYITPLIAMQCSLKFFAGRYLVDTCQLSKSVPRLLLDNDRPVVRLLEIRRHEKREAQIYDRSIHGLGPSSD